MRRLPRAIVAEMISRRLDQVDRLLEEPPTAARKKSFDVAARQVASMIRQVERIQRGGECALGRALSDVVVFSKQLGHHPEVEVLEDPFLKDFFQETRAGREFLMRDLTPRQIADIALETAREELEVWKNYTK